MSDLLSKLLIIFALFSLAGCTSRIAMPPNADPTYCHLNAKFVHQGYYPQPVSLPATTPALTNNGTASTPTSYSYPHRVGTGPMLAPR